MGDQVVVGITSDAFAEQRKEQVVPFEERERAVREHLLRFHKPFEIVAIDTVEGGMDQRKDIDALVVSPETLGPGEGINAKRGTNGLPPLRIIVVPHVLADDCTPISASRIMKGEIDAEGRLLRPLKVIVGSDNQLKVNAVRVVMERFYKRVEVIGIKVRTTVPEQPRGQETVQGAIERARATVGSGDADFGIGIEAGVFDMPYGLYDVQYCAVVDKRGHLTIGHGSGFCYPPEVAQEVKNGHTVGEAFRSLYGWDEGLRQEGAIGFLTQGVLKRTELSEQAVIAAMVPRIRRDLYPEL